MIKLFKKQNTEANINGTTVLNISQYCCSRG